MGRSFPKPELGLMLLLLDRDWAVLSESDVWGEVTAAWLITIVCLVCLWLT